MSQTNLPTPSQNILVVGATGGTGRATVQLLIEEGHRVTAFTRNLDAWVGAPAQVTPFMGDATNAADVARAVKGHDAVIVTLGIAENPLRVRFFGTARTPLDVRSSGTRNVIVAMRHHGVRRLVVQTTYGVGQTRDKLRWMERLFFNLLLKPQIADTEVQELAVRESGVDWVVAQPVHLNDDDTQDMPFTSATGEVQEWKISRKGVARFLARAVQVPDFVGQAVAVSGARSR